MTPEERKLIEQFRPKVEDAKKRLTDAVVKFVAHILGFFLSGWFVKLIWNGVVTSLLHVRSLTYWESVGLMILCQILFQPDKVSIRKD